MNDVAYWSVATKTVIQFWLIILISKNTYIEIEEGEVELDKAAASNPISTPYHYPTKLPPAALPSYRLPQQS